MLRAIYASAAVATPGLNWTLQVCDAPLTYQTYQEVKKEVGVAHGPKVRGLGPSQDVITAAVQRKQFITINSYD